MCADHTLSAGYPRIPPPRFIGQAVRYPMASFFLRREQGAKRAAVIRR